MKMPGKELDLLLITAAMFKRLSEKESLSPELRKLHAEKLRRVQADIADVRAQSVVPPEADSTPKCSRCGEATEHGKVLCERCACEAAGGDEWFECPSCGRDAENPGPVCLGCVTGTVH